MRFVRMDIPSYERKPNPDYARLRHLYSTDEDPIELTFGVTSSQVGKEITLDRKVVDPLAD